MVRWLREGSIEQKVFAAGGKDGQPVGLCFQSLAKLAVTENEIKSIRVTVVMIIGNRDGLRALYVDPLRKLRSDWAVIEVPDGNHLSCIFNSQFRDAVSRSHRNRAEEKSVAAQKCTGLFPVNSALIILRSFQIHDRLA